MANDIITTATKEINNLDTMVHMRCKLRNLSMRLNNSSVKKNTASNMCSLDFGN